MTLPRVFFLFVPLTVGRSSGWTERAHNSESDVDQQVSPQMHTHYFLSGG